LTTTVLEEALAQCRLWADRGLDLPVAVTSPFGTCWIRDSRGR
jgi:hypothetical protein